MIKEFDKYNKINEYFNSKYKYENIIIEINNINEFFEIEKYIKEIIYPMLGDKDIDQTIWNDIFFNLNYDIYNKPYYIRISHINNIYLNYSYDISYGTMEFYYETVKNDFNHERLFTIYDVRRDFLSNIIKYGISSLPSYKPRKIDKNI